MVFAFYLSNKNFCESCIKGQKLEDEGISLVTSLASFCNTLSTASVTDLASTGSGKDVEFISNIIDSLSTLSNSPFFDTLTSDRKEQLLTAFQADEVSYDGRMLVEPVSSIIQSEQLQESFAPDVISLETDSPLIKIISQVARAFTDRCNKFHKMLVQLLSHLLHSSSKGKLLVTSSVGTNDKVDGDKEKPDLLSDDALNNNDIFHVASLHRQLSVLQNSCAELENQLEEMAHSRDEANESERKVRRALYRLASGQLKLSEVLQVFRTALNVQFYIIIFTYA